MARCRARATLIAYVPLGVSLPGAVRILQSRGLTIASVNEELRRILASGPLERAAEAARALLEYGVPRSMISMEVSLACRAKLPRAPRGLRRIGGPRRFLAGVVAGRVVAVEEKPGGLLIIKIGRRTSLGRLPGPPQPGDFVLPEPPSRGELEEVARALLEGDE